MTFRALAPCLYALAATYLVSEKGFLMNEQLVVFAMLSIRSRLQSAPHSADTVSGIHSFWIEWTEPVPSQAITLEALQRLASTGLVE